MNNDVVLFSWECEDIEVIESSFVVATVVGGVGDGVRELGLRVFL